MLEKIREKRRLLEAYRSVFLSTEGRLVLKDLMRSTYFYDSVQDTDSNVMNFNEGQRALILRILKTLKVSHDQIEKMFDEELFNE